MTGSAKIGVALVGGYLLGRTKKAKMAIGLGMFLAGKKLSLDPRELGKLIANSPVLGTLNDQARKELVDATKTAATTALTKRMGGLADSLHERTLNLDNPAALQDRDEDEEEDEEEPRESRSERDDDDREADDSAKDEKPAPKRRAPAKKTAAKSTTSAAKKSTSGARRSTGGARKTASRASGTAKSRGGSNG